MMFGATDQWRRFLYIIHLLASWTLHQIKQSYGTQGHGSSLSTIPAVHNVRKRLDSPVRYLPIMFHDSFTDIVLREGVVEHMKMYKMNTHSR